VKRTTVLAFVVSAAFGIYWGVERHTTALLQTRLDAARDRQDEIARLRQEHGRLLRLQPAEDNLEHLRAEVRKARQAGQSADEQAKPGAGSLRPGIWASASAWKDQGRATPEAALETMLWAASGGNVASLKDVLVLAPETRIKAAEMISNLQDSSRQQYASPEDLMAVVVAGNVPLDSAQVVARQQNQDDQVIEYLRLKDSNGNTRQVFLSLQKTTDGWQLTVPPSAIDQIAKKQDGSSVP
jgi:hypothetical protein